MTRVVASVMVGGLLALTHAPDWAAVLFFGLAFVVWLETNDKRPDQN